MPNEIFSRLDAPKRAIIDELVEKGWEFADASWESGHNGDPYYDVSFKSPRMGDSVTIGEHQWTEVTKKFLLEKEAQRLALEWADEVFTSRHDLSTPVTRALAKYFLKSGTVKGNKISKYDDVKYIVKLAKGMKKSPKKIKITIEIS